MEVICFEDKAFFAMLDEVKKYLKVTNKIEEDEWVSGEKP
jgi:hypothetical protein